VKLAAHLIESADAKLGRDGVQRVEVTLRPTP
jgi:hypothetical protein